MADSKISALTELSAAPATSDLLVLVDISDTTMAASGTNKKITWANLTVALTNGTTTMATSQAQMFTNGVITGKIYPASNSTNAIGIYRADGTTQDLQYDSTNRRFGFGVAPSYFIDGLRDSNGAERVHFKQANAGSSAQLLFELENDGAKKMQFGLTSSGYTSTPDLAFLQGNGVPLALRSTFVSGYITFGGGSSGTERARMDANGLWGFGGITVPTAIVHTGASTTTRASMLIASGTAPTTPNTGDIWDDGALVSYHIDATTNAVVNSLKLRRGSSGTPAAGFGLSIAAKLESSTTEDQDAGRLTWAWSTATHASRAAVGKLTAYYTSTERELITWTAASTADTSTVNMAAATLVTLDDADTVPNQFAIQGSTNNNKQLMLGFNTTSNYGSIQAVIHGDTYYPLILQPVGSKVGIGVTSPQSLLHGHDGSGGFMFVNRTAVGGTAVTLIPNGTGDVTASLWFVGWCSNSSPFTADITATTLAVSSSTTKSDGVNTLTIAVAADGSVTLQATAGAATWNVFMWMMWR